MSLGAHVLFQLHQKAPLAHEGMQREVWLVLIELVGEQESSRKRRHAEVDELVLELIGAKAACTTATMRSCIGDGEDRTSIQHVLVRLFPYAASSRPASSGPDVRAGYTVATRER